MTTETPVPESIRALIAELAQVEDAVPACPHLRARQRTCRASVGPELLTLWRREAQIVAALRRHSVATS